MIKFSWRLQKVLDLKKLEEKSKTSGLAKVASELEAVEKEIIKNKKMLNKIMSEMSQATGSIRLRLQEFFMIHSASTDEKIKKLIKEKDKLRDKQKELLEEIIKLKHYIDGLEKLREKAKAEYIAEQEKSEQKEVDDNSSMRIARDILVKS